MKDIGPRPNAIRAIVCSLVLLSCARADDKPTNVTIADIEAAWTKHEKAFEAVEVVWAEDYYIRRGNLTRTLQGLGGRRAREVNPTNAVLPSSDVTFKVKGFMAVTKAALYVERDEPVWVQSKSVYAPSLLKCLWNTTGYRELRPGGTPDAPWPQADVLHKGRCPVTVMPYCRPIIFSFRPIGKAFRQVSTDSLVLTGRRLRIKSESCVEVHSPGAAGSGPENTLWLQPTWPHLPRRMTVHHKGRIVVAIDVSYKQQTNTTWTPQSWNVVLNDTAGEMSESISGSMVQVSNSVTTPLDLPIPPKTRVYDATQPAPRQHYITREGSSPFVLGRDTVGKSYNEMLEAMATDSNRTESSWLLLGGTAAIGLFTMAWVVRRYWSRTRKPQHSED